MTHNTAGETAGVTAGPSHVAILPTPAVNGTDNTGLTDMDINTPFHTNRKLTDSPITGGGRIITNPFQMALLMSSVILELDVGLQLNSALMMGVTTHMREVSMSPLDCKS